VRNATRNAAAAALWLAASCGDPTAPTINPVDYLLAEIDGSWSASAASYLALSNTPVASVRPEASKCVYNAATKYFECPPRVDEGFTYDLSYQLLAGGSNPLAAYEAKSTAAVHTVIDVAGNRVYDPTLSLAISSHSDRTLTGVLTGAPTVNGTDTATFILVSGALADTTYSVTTIADFKVQPRNSPTFPTGVITTFYFFQAPGPSAVAAYTHTLTFNASQFMTSVYHNGSITRTCIFDLKGISSPVCTTS
jgi:hypothetical protein